MVHLDCHIMTHIHEMLVTYKYVLNFVIFLGEICKMQIVYPPPVSSTNRIQREHRRQLCELVFREVQN